MGEWAIDLQISLFKLFACMFASFFFLIHLYPSDSEKTKEKKNNNKVMDLQIVHVNYIF